MPRWIKITAASYIYEIRREDNERVNSTAAFDKQYLEGRYGADPYLQNILSENEWGGEPKCPMAVTDDRISESDSV